MSFFSLLGLDIPGIIKALILFPKLFVSEIQGKNTPATLYLAPNHTVWDACFP